MKDRPGWDGTRLWPHPTYSTAEYEISQEEILVAELTGDNDNNENENATALTDIEEADEDEDEEHDEFA